MKILLLLLLLMSLSRTSTHPALVLRPDRSQFFEYEDISLSCEETDSDWTVWRYSKTGSQMSPCGLDWGVPGSASSCQLTNVKTFHSGTFWCQSELRDSSGGVQVQVSDGAVILDSPVVPVPAGQDVVLRCRVRETKTRTKTIVAHFLKNGVQMGAEPSDHMTIRNVSHTDQDVYACQVSGQGTSPSSWLLVHDGSEPPSLAVSPDSSQLLEYDRLLLSCGASGAPGWTVLRFPTASPGGVSRCGREFGTRRESGCLLHTVKQTDSALYWCQGPGLRRSNAVNISVFDRPVLLQIPALPEKEGNNVTLTCRSKSSGTPVQFFKDGVAMETVSGNTLSLWGVTAADGGEYRCSVSGGAESPPGRLLVRGSSGATPGSGPARLGLTVVRFLLVCSPYAVCTVLAVLLSQKKPAGSREPVAVTTYPPGDEDEQYDDVTTEHHF